ncbi:MAG: hypothetical protein M0Q24_11055 [Sulfurimonas sp.]|jgi:predicted RNA-binding Zn-ribbon protein involved in translation (DUF1610 family)|uniref:hypothetical protein n=1 Tax=Sulfurimonas sp. TaxID=2022749 RepID=UPI0025E5D2A2|nr:hypothetical protein [Sulfurimonas sp.]MCK9492612.1 hypothetical protein [Sulfurimonas sp.]
MGGYNHENQTWFLSCLWCGEIMETTEAVVKDQILLQQQIGKHACPNCGIQAPAKGRITLSGIMEFACTNCGFKEILTPYGFEQYMKVIGGRLNP